MARHALRTDSAGSRGVSECDGVSLLWKRSRYHTTAAAPAQRSTEAQKPEKEDEKAHGGREQPQRQPTPSIPGPTGLDKLFQL